METSALRQLLKSLCSNSVWNYAVLWKLRHENPVILSWEDGYFNYPKTGFEEIVSDDACCKDASDIISPDFEVNISSGNSEDYPVRLVAADMSSLQYIMGEGVVGKVASTRDHSWVSFNDIFTSEVKCPEEWLLQFASGIKTILLVPVLPHGVLQLGSLEEVLEDVNIVAFVKSKCTSLCNVWDNATSFSLKNESEAQLFSNPIKNSDASLSVALTSVKSEYLEPLEPISTFELESDNLSITNQDLMLLRAQGASLPNGKYLQEAFNYGRENMNNVPCTGLVEIETSTGLEMVESKLLDLSSLMEELQAYSDCCDLNVGLYGESFNTFMDSHPIDDFGGETSTGKAVLSNNIISSCLELHEGSELHKALQPINEKQPNEIFWDLTPLAEDASNTNKNPSERIELSWFARGAEAGYLLEDVVAKANTGTENNYGIRNNFTSCNSFSGQFTASPISNKMSNWSSPSDDSTPWSHLTSTRTANSTPDNFRSMMSTMLREVHQGGESDDLRLLENKTQNTSKRRAKPGNNQKPRPRDRQLIQDRVKELRELVPNGAKCSIDSLLDKTVNHMLYLRSVADQAEKLRQCAPLELNGSKSRRYADAKDSCANGTSWALEVGNEFRLCPIFVEDLNYPGCMLIEILCNDDGLFLEIAETIRGLELTILKGVQESRSDNTWAQFIVEVSKGFHRLDIFWPLVQLLQRKRKPISSRI